MVGTEPDFIVPQIRQTSEVKFHSDTAPGLRFLAIDASIRSGAPIYIAVRRVTCCLPDQPEYIDWHAHSVDSVYLFLGEEEGMRGLQALVRFGDQEVQIESPMTVFIPAGVAHSYKLIGGSGSYVSILLNGNYNKSTNPVKAPAKVYKRDYKP
jgi:2-isopropylmalate synthase